MALNCCCSRSPNLKPQLLLGPGACRGLLPSLSAQGQGQCRPAPWQYAHKAPDRGQFLVRVLDVALRGGISVSFKAVLVGSSRIDSLEAKPRLVPAPAGLHETLARLPAAARGAGRTALAAHSHLALHVSLWKRFDAGNLLCKARSHLQRVFL